MDEYWETPEARAWLKRVDADLVPKLQASAATISIVPRGETDLKFAVELGLSILFDKPIMLAVPPGTQIPEHLARVADDIVELDMRGHNAQARLGTQIKAFMQRIAAKEAGR